VRVNGVAQPHASQLPADLLETVVKAVAGGESWTPEEVVHCDSHSNDFAEVRLRGGRSLVVKRGRYDWAGPRFATSRIASRMIREATNVAVPAPLPLPVQIGDRPLEAYWRIDVPTLREIWPELNEADRRSALRSWGDLTGRLHTVELDGYGQLAEGCRHPSLREYLRSELEDRLLPAITVEWPEALGIVRRLRPFLDEVEDRVGGRSRLVHNDLHMGNILCETGEAAPVCVGLIDLETSIAAPPEADIAGMEVHHGPLFAQRLPRGWAQRVRSGYHHVVDERVVNFYRVFHLLNMGFYSALVGHALHAVEVAAAAAREVGRLERRQLVPLPTA
jgi:aminoglycoside phosphotransferase (APT) family kinase protein